ncbi:MAG: universal stress protein UspA related nucleotide-binding protein [uncultured archaeon A07HN63]|nr:MAG: universal stress protein UspA related nucleotide-binding protein [uncultured archaeon A07HN63]
MYDRLLFPTDGSDGAEAVTDDVLDIAAAHDATLHVLNVADTAHDSVTRVGDEVIDVFEQEGETLVEKTAATAAERGIETETAVVQGSVPETITEYADTAEIDLIVMPTRGRRGIEEFLLGSTTERVVRTAATPVLTLRPENAGFDYPFESLLVPTDGSDPATQALDLAAEAAADTAATLNVLSAVDTSVFAGSDALPQLDALEAEASTAVDAAADRAASAGVAEVVTAVEHGSSIPAAIRSYADEAGVDCILLGTHGRTGLNRYLLGSVAEALVRSADRPVLIVPQDADTTAGDG